MCHVCPHAHTSNPRERKKNPEKSRKMATQHSPTLSSCLYSVYLRGRGGGYNRVSVKKCSLTLNIICCVELLNFLFPLDFSPKSFFFLPIPSFTVYQDWGVEGVILHTSEMEGTQAKAWPAKANNMYHTCSNLAL